MDKTVVKTINQFQSTLPVRGATLHDSRRHTKLPISIHAPRAGSDALFSACFHCVRRISIHAPRAGSDSAIWLNHDMSELNFNPRSPCGERPHPPRHMDTPRHFNPRSPCGERRAYRPRLPYPEGISIHAPRAGSDRFSTDFFVHFTQFQSTLPVRGATGIARAGTP